MEIMSVVIPVIPFKIDVSKRKSCLVKVLNTRDRPIKASFKTNERKTIRLGNWY